MLPFDRYIKSYVLYQGLFLVLLASEPVLLLLFFSFLTQSAFFALGLALFFFTLFSFFVFRVYYQAVKPEQFERFINEWVGSRQENEFIRLSDALSGREQTCYIPPKRLSFLAPWLARISFWCHWEDFMMFRELLLKRALKEYYKTVRNYPTHPNVHAQLAEAYIKLSSLYRCFSQKLGRKQEFRFWFRRKLDNLESNFKASTLKAIEELKILKELTPQDTGADLQLALLYHELHRVQEEILHYEMILENTPHHEEACFRLGSLYFQQGMHAKGLQMYQLLKSRQAGNAEELLKFYDAENCIDV